MCDNIRFPTISGGARLTREHTYLSDQFRSQLTLPKSKEDPGRDLAKFVDRDGNHVAIASTNKPAEFLLPGAASIHPVDNKHPRNVPRCRTMKLVSDFSF